jgi:hypothetical protein
VNNHVSQVLLAGYVIVFHSQFQNLGFEISTELNGYAIVLEGAALAWPAVWQGADLSWLELGLKSLHARMML